MPNGDEELFEPIGEARSRPTPVSEIVRSWFEQIWLTRRRALLAIHGIEVVQAVQKFRLPRELPLGSGLRWRWNNSVPLVARKRTMVRVYVGTPTGGGVLPDVTGTLKLSPIGSGPGGLISGVSGPGGHEAWSPMVIRPINEHEVTTAWQAQYVSRESLSPLWNDESTLNFVLPVDVLSGRVRLQVEVHPKGLMGLFLRPRASTVVEFHERRLPEKLVPGLIVHPLAPQPAPLGYYYNCLDQVTATFPAPDEDFALHPVPGLERIEIKSDLFTDAGWQEMLARLQQISKRNLTDDRVLAALLPPGLSPAIAASQSFSPQLAHGGISGIGGGPIAFVDADAFAHELGHHFGLNHAAQGKPNEQGDEDPRIPSDTTDELGVDMSKKVLMSKGSWDIMHYINSPPKWISTDTWQLLFDQFAP